MRPNPKVCLAFVGVLLLGACGGSDSTAVNTDARGTYTMRTLNGSPVPLTAPNDATDPTSTITIEGGSFVIISDKDFTETISYHFSQGGQTQPTTTSVCAGTYLQSGATFTFMEADSTDPNCGTGYTGSWNGSNRFAIDFDPTVQVVYTK